MLQKYPDTVAALLSSYGKGVALWGQDPQKAAAMVGKETGLSTADALTNMKEYEFISLKQSLSPQWLGPPGQAGQLATILRRTAEFLHSQKSVRTVPALSVFEKGIDSGPLAKAAG